MKDFWRAERAAAACGGRNDGIVDDAVAADAGLSADARKRLSDLWASINSDPEMSELAARSGFELVNIGLDQMDGFMKEKTRLYTEGAKRLNLGK